MRNPFTMLYNKVTQKFGERWRVKSNEPIEKEKEKHRSSVGGGSCIAKVSNDDKEKKKSALYFPNKIWKMKKKRRRMSRKSRRINRLKRQHKRAA